MRYWWVNQNQTFRQEMAGGYLWSPKRNKNGARNPFYDFMRGVSPGDMVLSFEGTYIRAIGVARSHAYECPKPPEFGAAGPNWERIGWKTDVRWFRLRHQIRPAEHMDRLRPVLPSKYSPLQASGGGLQGVYLTTVPPPMMDVLVGLIGHEARDLLRANVSLEEVGEYGRGLLEWEEHLRDQVARDPALADTDRLAIILARRGQGKFKSNVQAVEYRCRVTGVERLEHLRASHIQPWRDSDNSQRLDGENGLLLTPSLDHLFDRGFISFENNGRLLISSTAHQASLRRMGVPLDGRFTVGAFTERQRSYLDFHRNDVFLSVPHAEMQSGLTEGPDSGVYRGQST